jgi:hypothetical protein
MKNLLNGLLLFLPAILYADSGQSVYDESVTVVDKIEINHFYTDGAVWTFDQLIFYKFDYLKCRFEVIDWRMCKDYRKKMTDEELVKLKEDNKKQYMKEWGWKKWPEGHPIPIDPPLALSKQISVEYKNNKVYLTWYDLASKNQYIVISNSLVHSWTQYDVELAEREYLFKENRLQLNHPVDYKERKKLFFPKEIE